MRALLRANRADDELARALAKVGLYVVRAAGASEVAPRIAAGDFAVVDPRLLAGGAVPAQARGEAGPPPESQPLEELCYLRLAALLDKLQGGSFPNLYATVMEQTERALLRLATERTQGITAASELLGIHRNTLARRLEELGMRPRAARRAPAASKASQAKGAAAKAPSKAPLAKGAAARAPSKASQARGAASRAPSKASREKGAAANASAAKPPAGARKARSAAGRRDGA